MTPDYIPFILGPCLSVCLNIPNFIFQYIDFMIFPKNDLYVELRLL